MRAITIRPPWSWAIAEAAALTALGVPPKLVENRGRKVAAEHIGQDWAIHAGRTWDEAGAEDLRVRAAWRAYWGKRLGRRPVHMEMPTGRPQIRVGIPEEVG